MIRFYYVGFILFLINLLPECEYTISSKGRNPARCSLINISPDKPILTVQDTFSRNSIRKKISEKIKNNQPLFVHVFVPLCDNIHQGIVKVSKSLGDGKNLKTNLYWGAGYGIGNYFSKHKQWKTVYNIKDLDSNVLERIIFKRVYSNNALVYLIADAYSGDKMHHCLMDFFSSLSGSKIDTIDCSGAKIAIYGGCDFCIFNGHNGLMDTYIENSYELISNQKDAGAIACLSYPFFYKYFLAIQAYPLITTESLLGPEAYILEAVIDSWALQHSEKDLKNAAGDAVAFIHKLSKNACRKMFRTGW